MREYNAGVFKSLGDYVSAVGASKSFESNESNDVKPKRVGGDTFEAKEKRMKDYNSYLSGKVFDYDDLTKMFESCDKEFYISGGNVKIRDINSLAKDSELVDSKTLLAILRNFYLISNSDYLYDEIDQKTHSEIPRLFLKSFINYLSPILEKNVINKDNYINSEIKVSGIKEARIVLSNKDDVLKLNSKNSIRTIETFLYNAFNGDYSKSNLNISYCIKELLNSKFFRTIDDNLKELFFVTLFKDLHSDNSFLNQAEPNLKIRHVLSEFIKYIHEINALTREVGYYNSDILYNDKVMINSDNKDNCNLVIELARGGALKKDDNRKQLKYILEKNLFSITAMFDEADEQDNLRIDRLKEILDNYLNKNENNYNYTISKSNTGVNYLKIIFNDNTILLHPRFIIHLGKGILYINNESSITSFEENAKNLFNNDKLPKNLLNLFKYSIRAFDLRKSTKINMINRLFDK